MQDTQLRTAPSSLDDTLAQLTEQLARWHVPGLQVAVVRDGQVLHAGGAGVRGVDDPAPVGPDTLFHHGSCCKAYTSLLACVLADDGLLDLDAPVQKWIPELRLPEQDRAAQITTRDLLSHRSGLSRHDLAWILNPSWDREALLRRLEHLPVAAGLREQMEYSNLGYSLAGLVMERVTGSSWDDLLRDRVLVPLGMTRTTMSQPQMRADGDAAAAHLLRAGAAVPVTDRTLVGISPAGSLMTSANDAAQWLLVQLGARTTLPAAAIEATHELAIAMPSTVGIPHVELKGYGLGWMLASYRGRPMVWHSGGIDGFSTQTILLPEQQLGVVVSANVNGSVLAMAAAFHLLDAELGTAVEQSWYDLLHPLSLAAAAAAEPAPAHESPSPPRPLAELAGTYSHPGYGDLVLTVDGDRLRARLGESDLSVRHLDGDSWEIRYDVLDAAYAVTFEAGPDGSVDAAVAPLDPPSAPTRFIRSLA